MKEYDSYNFTSQRWRLLAHHFVSIDTWLEGICTPGHPELWKTPSPARTRGLGGGPAGGAGSWSGSGTGSHKYSLFAQEAQAGDEEAD